MQGNGEHLHSDSGPSPKLTNQYVILGTVLTPLWISILIWLSTVLSI